MRATAHNDGQVSPFGHPRINAQLAAPRGLTQPLTSFIGLPCQGIHRAPLNTHTTQKIKEHTLQKIKMLASTIQFSHNTTHTPATEGAPPAPTMGATHKGTCRPRHPTACRRTTYAPHRRPHTGPPTTTGRPGPDGPGKHGAPRFPRRTASTRIQKRAPPAGPQDHANDATTIITP